MSPAHVQKHLLALLNLYHDSEPEDAVVVDDASMDAVVDGAFDLLTDLRSPCPPTAAAVLLTEAEGCRTGNS